MRLIVVSIVLIAVAVVLANRLWVSAPANETSSSSKHEAVRENFFGGDGPKEIPAGQKMAPRW
ncbi:MAG: entry exclusion protein TrbK [Rhizobiaceae bacterium]